MVTMQIFIGINKEMPVRNVPHRPSEASPANLYLHGVIEAFMHCGL